MTAINRAETRMKAHNKVVVITGSASGIGHAAALRFAREGAAMVINSRRNRAGGEATVEAVREAGGRAVYVQADLSQPAAVQSLFERAVTEFGGVDVLINNAGHTEAQPFASASKAHWLTMLDTNLLTAVLCAHAAAPLMLARGGGSIVNVASIRGLEHAGTEAAIAYSTAKAALISFTKTLAKVLAPAICVNAIAPGFVYTESYTAIPPDSQQQMIDATLIKRFITVDEVADALWFVAGNRALTGTVLVMDGGFSLGSK
jgi:3-oxoacyl-[acyl-carrier protein] reductase